MNPYTQLTRAFKQAPWRAQTQAIAAAAVFFVVLAAVGGLYLATATRAATAGRDVQQLEVEKADLLLEIDQLQADVASARSVSRMEARARELGFVPAKNDQVEYIVVAGYPQPPPTPAATAAPVPNYDETLTSWLAGRLESVTGPAR
ncbi:MAG: hypothetical protein HY023_18035 [Chloroflexi bacterium]|nr:hypothetical protein [Chloroflexota bacterium]MBI3764534.1 hypothetical protein [Chloroflexota bacterium]